MNSIVTTFFFLTAFFPSALRMEAVSIAAVAPAQVDLSVVERADKYLKSVLAGDAFAIAGMFREDAVLMPADPLCCGVASRLTSTIANGSGVQPKSLRLPSVTWSPRFLATRPSMSAPTTKPCRWVTPQ
jgi:hypothetical protein